MAAHAVSERIRTGAKVIDVRTEDEFADEHYEGAVNIPVGELMSRIGELGEKDTPLILYCASGARSAMAAKMLKAAGFSDVINAGGLYDMP
jgi:phage shock protein E